MGGGGKGFDMVCCVFDMLIAVVNGRWTMTVFHQDRNPPFFFSKDLAKEQVASYSSKTAHVIS